MFYAMLLDDVPIGIYIIVNIWLNLELAKKPVRCLEYIIVHELTHLLEPRHNKRFKTFMDKFIPDWKQSRAELNRMPLINEQCISK